MIVAVDTNILLRYIVGDDQIQSPKATALIGQATKIIIPTTVFCELVWVLMRSYRIPRKEITAVISNLIQADKVICEAATISAGLAYLRQGGDFSDGVLTQQAIMLGAKTLASFDHKSLQLLQQNYPLIIEGLNPTEE